jgi:ubiquitin-protein ligase
MSTITVNKRVLKDIAEGTDILKDEFGILIEAEQSNMYNIHFILQGADDTPFEGGLYHGLIRLNPNHPISAPNIHMITPSGRFVPESYPLPVGSRGICTTATAFHPETWTPVTSITTVLKGFVSLMSDLNDVGVGGMKSSPDQIKKFARESINCLINDQIVKKMFPDLHQSLLDGTYKPTKMADLSRKSISVTESIKDKKLPSKSESDNSSEKCESENDNFSEKCESENDNFSEKYESENEIIYVSSSDDDKKPKKNHKKKPIKKLPSTKDNKNRSVKKELTDSDEDTKPKKNNKKKPTKKELSDSDEDTKPRKNNKKKPTKKELMDSDEDTKPKKNNKKKPTKKELSDSDEDTKPKKNNKKKPTKKELSDSDEEFKPKKNNKKKPTKKELSDSDEESKPKKNNKKKSTKK